MADEKRPIDALEEGEVEEDGNTTDSGRSPVRKKSRYHVSSYNFAQTNQENGNNTSEEQEDPTDSEMSGSQGPQRASRSIRQVNVFPAATLRDEHFGQRFAWPGLDDDDGEGGEQDDGPESTKEAMLFLKSVREEADALPFVMKAEATEDYSSAANFTPYGKTKPSGGFYSHGVYMAAPVLGPTLPPPSNRLQDAYHEHLKQSFLYIRKRLLQQPSQAEKDATKNHLTRFNSSTKRKWEQIISNSNPHRAPLSTMPLPERFRLLALCKARLQFKQNVPKLLSVWIWTLLASLPEVTMLSSPEVSDVRTLMKRACEVLENKDDDEDEEDEEMSEDDDEEGSDDDAEEYPDGNTKATLDMIFTVVGELFGQRDLLNYRQVWA
ncbi:hypothetical protein NA57DRAFT_71305 [Rhizodiscina lignyota]|uniref:Uncharacterized protein n=1 Tax=Rhizodiscina lignyota TaxID=1504668 RepID=A0A9P4IP73_9PEZI|nr:hypothetical protein NA57DRAFT_71305 [Rhizodiscina lignyota]